MGKERRYTKGQKVLLKFDRSELDEPEREVLRRVLLPRTKYLPCTDEEGRELALQMLKEEKYAAMLAMADEIRARYGELEFRWVRGEGFWDLFYSVRKNGTALCRFGLRFNLCELIVAFGKEECDQFERDRDMFPRGSVQWIYDMADVVRGSKTLMFDFTDPALRPYLFRLLAYKRKPEN